MPGPTLGELENESAADTMRGVIAEMASKNVEIEPSADVPVGAGKPAPVAGKAEADAAAARARDERGRFAPAEGKSTEQVAAEKDKTPAAKAPIVEAPDAGQEPPVVVDGADTEIIEPPHEWTAAEQDQFRALPPAAQRVVFDRIEKARVAAEEAGRIAQRYTGIDELLAPRRNGFARDGLDDVGAVRQLFALSDFAAKDPEGFARWFMDARGIQPERIVPPVQQQPQRAADGTIVPPDPLNPLNQRINDLEQFIKNDASGRAQEHERQQAQALNNEINAFGAARDDKGKLSRPYFEEVRPLMGSFIGSGQAPDLQTAYDMACRAHPEVFAKIESARKAAAAQDDARKQREKAASARQAGSSIAGTPGDRARPEPTGDLREDMRREFAERGML